MERISAWDDQIMPIMKLVHDMANDLPIKNAIRDLVEKAFREGREEEAKLHPQREDMGR